MTTSEEILPGAEAEAADAAPVDGAALRATARPAPRTTIQNLLVLFKFRIVLLLLFAAIGGMFLGAGGWPGLGALSLIVVTGGLAASGAAALNQYLERDSDMRMFRTQTRPLVTGEIARPAWVPVVATLMVLVPALAVLPFNPPLTFFLLLGAAVYVGIYTIWLKPRTLLNIVIGGAAGSAAVLSGSAAAGHWNDPGALVLAMLVFLWTPTHFWSLAIVYRDDYARGGAPMLPVRVGARHSAGWMLLHTTAAVLASLLLALRPRLGWIYLVPVAGASAVLLARNLRLLRNPDAAHARAFFKFSNYYLALVLFMIGLDSVVR